MPSLGANALGTDFAMLAKIFGDHSGFTAKSDFRVLDKNQKETVSAVLNFAYLDHKFRVEIDLGQMKNKDLPAGAGEAMKQFGIDRLVSIVRPDKKTSYLVFPGIQAYVRTPLSQQEAEAYDRKSKTEATVLGKETLDGHACVKKRITATDDTGATSAFTVWNASDLKDFPLQIVTKEKEDTVVIRYKEVKLAKPEGPLFDPPSGFKEYTDYAAMMQGVVMKMMSDTVAAPK